MSAELWLLLLFGMGNGLLHALDADHILAVSSVAVSGESSRARVLRTALMWALGHGVSLSLLIVFAVGFGWAIPETMSRVAEIGVGLILIAVGASIVYQLGKGSIRISHHRHDNLPAHTHIHKHQHGRRSDHRPVLVGVVHGVAGSAPLLALLPLMITEKFMAAGLYIFLFSSSVALMMCVFGGLLGSVVRFLHCRTAFGLQFLQAILSIQAISLGSYWIYSAL